MARKDINKAPPGSRRKIEKRADTHIPVEMTLQDLRLACKITQVNLANKLGIAQKQISKIEKRTDMHISTLRRSIEAMGGKLSLIAEFSDRPVMLVGITSLQTRKSRGHASKVSTK